MYAAEGGAGFGGNVCDIIATQVFRMSACWVGDIEEKPSFSKPRKSRIFIISDMRDRDQADPSNPPLGGGCRGHMINQSANWLVVRKKRGGHFFLFLRLGKLVKRLGGESSYIQ